MYANAFTDGWDLVVAHISGKLVSEQNAGPVDLWEPPGEDAPLTPLGARLAKRILTGTPGVTAVRMLSSVQRGNPDVLIVRRSPELATAASMLSQVREACEECGLFAVSLPPK
jgi:hypothetical protein